MDRSSTMNAEWLNPSMPHSFVLNNISKVNSQFVPVREENHDEPTNMIKKVVEKLC